MKIAVIGGGAAGFFGAIRITELNQNAEIVIFERSNKLLAKVKISGGGRCNVTHACFDNARLLSAYPRGFKELAGPFSRFNARDTISWFERHGVKLKIEPDGRMFPVTDNSQTIVDCLQSAVKKSGIRIIQQGIDEIIKDENGFELRGKDYSGLFDKILIAAGGLNKEDSYNWIKRLGHNIIQPVPSLFTFNVHDPSLHALSGISIPNVTLSIKGTKLKSEGPILFTHWGLSGPSILKLSAWGAVEFADLRYNFTLLINWMPDRNPESCIKMLEEFRQENIRNHLYSVPFNLFPSRFWKWILNKSGIPENMKWADLSKKALQSLANNLTMHEIKVQGKSTFKDEFVTAGGIDLKQVDMKTMESKIVPGLYFAGEVLNIDGITGGYNFQAAWTTSWIAGTSIADQ